MAFDREAAKGNKTIQAFELVVGPEEFFELEDLNTKMEKHPAPTIKEVLEPPPPSRSFQPNNPLRLVAYCVT
jgi:hypothetical protein